MKLNNLLSNITFVIGFILMLSDSDNLIILSLGKLLAIALIGISVSLLFHSKKA